MDRYVRQDLLGYGTYSMVSYSTRTNIRCTKDRTCYQMQWLHSRL